MIRRRRLLLWAGLAATTPAVAKATAATADTINYAGREPSSDEIVRRLLDQRKRPLPRTRSLGGQAGAAAEGDDGAQPRSSSPALSFDQIGFEFDSAELRTDARQTLDTIGRALSSSALTGMQFVIEGHTDAVGGFAYNIHLSRRRAHAVGQYLAARHGVDGQRLTFVGKGPTELLDGGNPESAVNRRVVLVAQRRG